MILWPCLFALSSSLPLMTFTGNNTHLDYARRIFEPFLQKRDKTALARLAVPQGLKGKPIVDGCAIPTLAECCAKADCPVCLLNPGLKIAHDVVGGMEQGAIELLTGLTKDQFANMFACGISAADCATIDATPIVQKVVPAELQPAFTALMPVVNAMNLGFNTYFQQEPGCPAIILHQQYDPNKYPLDFKVEGINVLNGGAAARVAAATTLVFAGWLMI